MIHYQVQCSKGHGFDGWFRDSAAFEAQAERGLVECPTCGDSSVRRALMAPAVPRKGRALLPPEPTPAPVAAPTPPAEPPTAVVAERLPDHVRAMLQRVRAEVEKRCDYVGEKFADEARRIHRGEATARGIYGETTPEQAEALSDEGIEVNRIPWVPRADG
jgi:hypothetical protein